MIVEHIVFYKITVKDKSKTECLQFEQGGQERPHEVSEFRQGNEK